MSELRHIDTLLPSQAYKALVEYFFKKLTTSKLDYAAQTTYRAMDAMNDALHSGSAYVERHYSKAYEEAKRTFEAVCPMVYDNLARKFVRQGFK